MARWKIAGISFEHFHMGDNLRMAAEHPDAEIVGICDPEPDRMELIASELGIGPERRFTDYRACLETTRPDVVLLCPAAAHHGDWVERVAPFGVDVLIEKPFATSLAEADTMVAAMSETGKRLAVNWPLAWYPSHRTARRLIDEGRIGHVLEIHYYDGNRGPLWHTVGKAEKSADQVAREKPESWFYTKAGGGGSLQDYLGYGTTLGTWLMDGRRPIEVTCTVDAPAGLEVDEHAVAVARYDTGLSKFETRWGTFTDPWTHQPQPRCGFVIVGTAGTIGSYDYAPTVHLQTRDCPQGRDVLVDRLEPPHQNPVQYFLDCLARDAPIEGPLSVEISRIGQQIVDTAVRSAAEKRTLPLVG